jgi:predicted porin
MLALALTPSVQAQPGYALYGVLDVALGSFQSAGSARLSHIQSGVMHTSFIGLSGEEALESGAKVLFNLESFLRPDSGESGRWTGAPSDGAWSRAANIGFSGSFGTVRMGRVANLMFVSSRAFNSFSATLGDAPTLSLAWSDPRGSAAQIEGDTAWSNALSYVGLSQDGWSFSGQAAAAEGNGSRNLGLTMGYTAPRFSASAAWQEVKVGLGGQKESTGSFGATYDWGAVKLYAQAIGIDDRAQGTLTKVMDLSLAAPLGQAGNLLLAWSRSVLDIDNSQASTLRLGYAHTLSPRTALYAMALQTQRTDLAHGNSVAMGLRHAF